MIRVRLRRAILSRNTLIGVVAAMVTMVGVSWAARPAKTGSIRACYEKKAGTLRFASKGKGCRKAERKLSWNQHGPRGARGRTGVSGLSGVGGRAGGVGAAGAMGPGGQTGSDGPTGFTGATGPTGPSAGFEARKTDAITVTGGDVGTANTIASLVGVQPGDYLLIARAQARGALTQAATVFCQASLGGKVATATAQIGSNANGADHVPLAITFNVTTATVGAADLKCWREALTGGAPVISDTYIELVKLGSASSVAL